MTGRPNQAKDAEDSVATRLEKCESLSTGHDLNLADLNLLAVPAQTLHLSSLRTLNLRHNNLTSLPVDFVECFPLLEVLNVAQNHLSHLPPDMGSLQKLRKLFVQSNQLRSLPLSLTGCTKLDQLFAQHNHLQDIPDEFALLSSLQILSVAHNQLTTLPKGLSALVKLEVVDLSGNAALTDVPENLRRLHDRHAVLHSKQARRDLITRALKVKRAVSQSLKTQARDMAIHVSK